MFLKHLFADTISTPVNNDNSNISRFVNSCKLLVMCATAHLGHPAVTTRSYEVPSTYKYRIETDFKADQKHYVYS